MEPVNYVNAVYDPNLAILFWVIVSCLVVTTTGLAGCAWYALSQFDKIKGMLDERRE